MEGGWDALDRSSSSAPRDRQETSQPVSAARRRELTPDEYRGCGRTGTYWYLHSCLSVCIGDPDPGPEPGPSVVPSSLWVWVLGLRSVRSSLTKSTQSMHVGLSYSCSRSNADIIEDR